jgi:hypothetical protein
VNDASFVASGCGLSLTMNYDLCNEQVGAFVEKI